MNLFNLLAVVIFIIAFMQGIKAGILGTLIGLVVGAGAACAFFYGGFIFYDWLPKRLGIYELTKYREEDFNTKKERVLSTIYSSIIIFGCFIWFILCCLCSFYLTKFLIGGLGGN